MTPKPPFTCICRHCEEPFKAGSPNTGWCPEPECQEARRVHKLDYDNNYHKDNYARRQEEQQKQYASPKIKAKEPKERPCMKCRKPFTPENDEHFCAICDRIRQRYTEDDFHGQEVEVG